MRNKIENIKNFIVENVFFLFAVVIAILFITSPVWIKIKGLSKVVSLFLAPLKSEGYKSSYIGAMGGLIGTFLAVSAALWTQRRIDEKEEKNRIREKTLIIYYDFHFAFYDIWNCIREFAENVPILGFDLKDNQIKDFIASVRTLEIRICNEWITNIADVSKYFTDNEIKEMYTMYSDLVKIEEILKRAVETVENSEWNSLYKLMNNYVYEISGENYERVGIMVTQKVFDICNKLRKVGRF